MPSPTNTPRTGKTPNRIEKKLHIVQVFYIQFFCDLCFLINYLSQGRVFFFVLFDATLIEITCVFFCLFLCFRLATRLEFFFFDGFCLGSFEWWNCVLLKLDWKWRSEEFLECSNLVLLFEVIECVLQYSMKPYGKYCGLDCYDNYPKLD